MKFYTPEKFWKTVNTWVRDGSNIVSVMDSYGVVEICLLGKDGGSELLKLYHSLIDYYRDNYLVEGD